MRSRKASLNAIASILYEITRVISAFLIPRLVLQNFGSDTNGINQAVTQFISYISLLTAGIGSVTTAALYKPIADNDNEKISGIVNATERFLKKIATIFIVALLLFASIFPFTIEEFDYLFTFSLVLILGIGTFAHYYFGLTYKMILNADQKQYISSLLQTILSIIQTAVAVIMMNNKLNIHLVQFVSSLIFLVNPVFIYYFVKRKYKINKGIPPNYKSINQRWDAFGHQIANFVNNNIDLLLLTIFTNLKEVSVFSVYILILNGVKTIIGSIVTSTQSAFGNMFARGEIKSVEKNLRLYEFFIHTISIVLYTSTALLITSFIDIYTKEILDVSYHRPISGYLLSAVGFFVAVRIPYESVTWAAGHFKQTRNGAIIEAILNIVLSIILVIPFGINGLLIGTLITTIFRTIQYGIYSSKKLLDRNIKIIIKRYIISILVIIVIVFITQFIPLLEIINYYTWVINGFIITGIGIVVTLIFSFLFYFHDLVDMINFILRVFKNKNK